jgi:hypothetical protein
VFRIRVRIWIQSGQGICNRIRDPDPGRAKMTHKSRRKFWKCHVLKCWVFSFEAEGFFCSLDVLYGRLGISKLLFLIKKVYFFHLLIFFSSWSSNPGSNTTVDPNLDQMNTDPKHWSKPSSFGPKNSFIHEMSPFICCPGHLGLDPIGFGT